MPVASPGGFMGATAPAGSVQNAKLPAYYEYLAPSRWKDGRLTKAQAKATADRLFKDSLERNARKHDPGDEPMGDAGGEVASRREAEAEAEAESDPPAAASRGGSGFFVALVGGARRLATSSAS